MSEALAGERRYFLTYSGVKLPFKLSSPLEPSQVENRNTYFVGYYDGEGRLTGFHKMVYGEVELTHRYTYDETGTLRRAEVSDIDEEVTLLEFDQDGRTIGG